MRRGRDDEERETDGQRHEPDRLRGPTRADEAARGDLRRARRDERERREQRE
jgi:hypothetical protein